VRKLDVDNFKKQYDENEEIKKTFAQGFERGAEYAKKEIKYNQMLRTLLLEVIGYEDEWLTTSEGYKRYKKDELIDIILKQRALMRTAYTKVETPEKEKLKFKIENFFGQ
jgi:fumarate hydratase class II